MRKLENSELDRKTVEDFKDAQKTPITIILNDIRSLNNIGSVFRTADAFLLQKIFLCGITAVPPNKEIHKTALGATETVDWQYCESVLDAIEIARNNGATIAAIEQVEGSVSLEDFEVDTEKKYALIFGNEVFGVSEEAVQNSDLCIEIPQLGTKHSLNISVSAGIVIWDLFAKIRSL